MPAIEHVTKKLRGKLVSFKVRSDDGWGTGTFERELSDTDRAKGFAFEEIISVTGKVLNVREGDSVELDGSWTDTKYGKQFKIKTATPIAPATNEGVVSWMCSRFPDVGRNRALEMVARFGDTLWQTIEGNPLALCEIRGITPERADSIRAAYLENIGERDHMIKLRGWGLTDNQISRCLVEWKKLDVVIERLTENPYQLAQVVHGFGFLRADKVALAMGIDPEAPSRIRAGVLHTLEEASSEGHTYVAGGKLREMASRMLGVDSKKVVAEILWVVDAGQVVRRDWRVYSKRMDAAETTCANALRRMLGKGNAA